MEDRSWMYTGGGGDAVVYFQKVTGFVEEAKRHARRRGTQYIYCPCTRCKNMFMFETPETIREHLLEKGFIKDYYIWIKHGEIGPHAQGDHVEEVIRARVDHDERRVRAKRSTEYATTSGHTDGPELVNESEDFDSGLDVEELLMHINNENLVQKKKASFG